MLTFLFNKQKIKNLTIKLKKTTGRNNTGSIVVRHKGGGVSKQYRIIDFKNIFLNIPMIPLRIEYDPYRSSYILLCFYLNGFFSYKLLVDGIRNFLFFENFFLISSFYAEIKNGNNLPLKHIPIGTIICNIELYFGSGAILARSAGCFGQLLSKGFLKNKYVLIRLKSGEEYLLNQNCFATIGIISNTEHHLKKKKKAGVSRLLNKKPHVRGVAMNPVDHPHGGGEGKTSGGRPSVSYKGKLTKGVPTRKKKKINFKIYLSRKKKIKQF